MGDGEFRGYVGFAGIRYDCRVKQAESTEAENTNNSKSLLLLSLLHFLCRICHDLLGNVVTFLLLDSSLYNA